MRYYLLVNRIINCGRIDDQDFVFCNNATLKYNIKKNGNKNTILHRHDIHF